MPDQNCKHTSFSTEQGDATGANIKIGIVRCSQCGTAIGALYPQALIALSALGDKLDAIQQEIKKLQH